MFNKIFILISLMVGSIVFADTAPDQKGIQEEEIFLSAFPESITINFTDENEGKLVIKLRTQEHSKHYPLSKSNTTNIRTIQHYKKGTIMKEEAEISFFDNTITVELQWFDLGLYLDERGEVKIRQTPIFPVRYEFIFNDDVLNFNRIVKETGADDNPLVFTAVYSESTLSSDQTQNIRSWTLREVTSNPNLEALPSTTPLVCSYIPTVCKPEWAEKSQYEVMDTNPARDLDSPVRVTRDSGGE